MPSINDQKLLSQASGSAFISPFSDRLPRSFYSSINSRLGAGDDCIPCAVVGVTDLEYAAAVEAVSTPRFSNFWSIQQRIISQTVPVIPPAPPLPPSAQYAEIELSPLFPYGGFFDPPGYPYGSGVTLPAYLEDRWIYSHSANPAAIDDNLEINGVRIVFPVIGGTIDGREWSIAGPINGGITTFLFKLTAGIPLNLNIYNAGGSYGASGSIRLYTSLL